MKRIGIDARFMLRPLRGMPLYVLRICQNVPSLNKDLQFVYFINKRYEHNDTPENYLPRIQEIEEKYPNVKFVNYDDDAEVRWEQVYLPRLIKEHKIDLLHMPGNRICFFSGVPTIVTVHDVIEAKEFRWEYVKNSLFKELRPRMIIYHARMLTYVWVNYRIGFHRASHIITVSNYSAKEIGETLHIQIGKLTSIYHGLDSEFELTESVTDKNLSLKSRNFSLMLGGDSQHKNPEGAIASWAKVPKSIRLKYPLRIIGFNGNSQSPLLSAIYKFGLEDEVEIMGWVTQSEMIENFRSAAIFIYLSRYEGFGFPPLHAMASGTPVIASNCTSIPEVLGDVGFTFNPDDHDGVANGIEQVLNNPVLWQTQSSLGLVRAKKFSWHDSADKHFKLYMKMLEKNHGSSI